MDTASAPAPRNGNFIIEEVPHVDETPRTSISAILHSRNSDKLQTDKSCRVVFRFASQYITGDCRGVSQWVDTQPPKLAWILCFFESLFRSLGKLVFIDNVWSGVLFLLACMLHNQFATLVGVLGVAVAYFVAIVLNTPEKTLRSGAITFNAFMVASFVATNARPLGETIWNPWLIFPAIFFSTLRYAQCTGNASTIDGRMFLLRSLLLLNWKRISNHFKAPLYR